MRDYVILDCFDHHFCNSLMESVYNHVIAELKPAERVENHVIAERTGVEGVHNHVIARSGRNGRVEDHVFMRDWGAVGSGRGLVRDYVILDSFYSHIYDYPAERVENHVIARVG